MDEFSNQNQCNRISPPSRWPLDPREQIKRANTDLAFVDVMRSGPIADDGTLDKIQSKALAVLDGARRQLREQEQGQRDSDRRIAGLDEEAPF